jgi:hypothetical protein
MTGSQCAIILTRLLDTPNEWVEMPELCRISDSLNAHSRIADLRKRGHTIENKTETINGKKHSFYRLVAHPVQEPLL